MSWEVESLRRWDQMLDRRRAKEKIPPELISQMRSLIAQFGILKVARELRHQKSRNHAIREIVKKRIQLKEATHV